MLAALGGGADAERLSRPGGGTSVAESADNLGGGARALEPVGGRAAPADPASLMVVQTAMPAPEGDKRDSLFATIMRRSQLAGGAVRALFPARLRARLRAAGPSPRRLAPSACSALTCRRMTSRSSTSTIAQAEV